MIWLQKGWIQLAIAAVVFLVGYFALPTDSRWKRASTWQKLATPGALSRAHANLEDDCVACHTSVQGVDPIKCVLCHATDEGLLQRQPTAFHANITSCKECHQEHAGAAGRPTKMDHEALARIGLGELGAETDAERFALQAFLQGWIDAGEPAAEGLRVTRAEATLACEACHANEDRHFGLLGTDCGQCHLTSMWTLPEFRHPSPKSRDCAQCHQAPPSHYMGHFKMVSATVARKPFATVDQCFECHRTTAWTDIPGIGHYKHH